MNYIHNLPGYRWLDDLNGVANLRKHLEGVHSCGLPHPPIIFPDERMNQCSFSSCPPAPDLPLIFAFGQTADQMQPRES